jgi:hypothetical protein
MKTKKTAFTIKPFKNRNGTISYRVAGWLLGERIRRNFKTRKAICQRQHDAIRTELTLFKDYSRLHLSIP